jgi:hypothetical protein
MDGQTVFLAFASKHSSISFNLNIVGDRCRFCDASQVSPNECGGDLSRLVAGSGRAGGVEIVEA